MTLHTLLSLWVFLFLFWPCIATGSPVRPDSQHPRGQTVHGRLGKEHRATSPDGLMQLRSMCVVIAEKYSGYKCLDYEVQTKDGYIISLVNIAAGRNEGSDKPSKQPVVLQHGIMADGMSWLLAQPDQALGYILADAGFDVWIINSRGTQFSRRHVTLNPLFPDYWNWSWDHLSKYDLPAALGFVFSKTKQKMHYIGHSMGTTQALAAFAEKREIDKLKSAALLSPVAYLNHMTSIMGVYACTVFLGELTVLLGMAEFDMTRQPARTFMQLFCDLPLANCMNMVDSFTANRDGKFRKYDYGSALLNNEQYGQPEPPLYDLTHIPNDFPLYITYGALDALTHPKDVNVLLDQLKGHGPDKLKVQMVQQYAHLDFIMGTNANDLVYKPLITYFKSQI